jgi:Pin2-interacting protein X1
MAAVLKADTQNASWQNTKQTTFAYKMMQKMGWSEGKGLGKLEDGINTHVRVQKREGSLGLGAARDRDGSAGWSSTAVSFSAVLANLNEAYKPAKSKKDKKKKKKSGSSSSSSSTEADVAVIDSAAAAADGISSGKAKVCQSRARRVKAKDIRTFSSADLKAILGQSSSAAVAYPVVSAYSSTTTITSTTTVTSSSSSSSSGKRKRAKDAGSSEESKAERKARKAKRKADKAAAAATDSDDS